MASEAGKGDAPRKNQDHNEYSKGWERIFGKEKDQRDVKQDVKTGTQNPKEVTK